VSENLFVSIPIYLIKRKQTTMDEDQKSAFNLAINGHNLLITGQGGTGKSFLVKIIIKHLSQSTIINANTDNYEELLINQIN
jgi:DNA replication protein DnaC